MRSLPKMVIYTFKKAQNCKKKKKKIKKKKKKKKKNHVY